MKVYEITESRIDEVAILPVFFWVARGIKFLMSAVAATRGYQVFAKIVSVLWKVVEAGLAAWVIVDMVNFIKEKGWDVSTWDFFDWLTALFFVIAVRTGVKITWNASKSLVKKMTKDADPETIATLKKIANSLESAVKKAEKKAAVGAGTIGAAAFPAKVASDETELAP